MNHSVIGIVDTSSEVETIVSDLERIGVPADDIAIASPDARVAAEPLPHIVRNATLAGIGLGSAAGGSFGLLAAFGGLALPGLETFMVAGPLAATASAAAVGAAIGCIGGWVSGTAKFERERDESRHALHQGNILIAVQVDSYESERLTESVLLRGGAHDVVIANESVTYDQYG